MYSCPPAWTPVVTRTATGATTPSSSAMAATTSISVSESTTIRPDAHLERVADLVVRLVVSVEGDARGGHPAPQRERELSARRHVETEPVVAHPARHLRAQEGLARVVHGARRAVLAERGRELVAELGGPPAHVRLVHDVQGRAVLGRERGYVAPADLELTALGSRDRPGPHVRDRKRRGRRRVGGHRYILSGAPTPSNPSPVARTWRVASLSHRRVRWTSPTGSSPWGVTRVRSYQAWKAPASSSR